MSLIRPTMVALALLEIYSGLQWLTDPYAAETELSGILAECGCGTATPCGSGAACRAYGRLMAFALFGLAMVECVAVGATCGPIVVVSRDFDLINPARCPPGSISPRFGPWVWRVDGGVGDACRRKRVLVARGVQRGITSAASTPTCAPKCGFAWATTVPCMLGLSPVTESILPFV